MSNNLDITVNDFENICRTCLSREDLNPLYEKCSGIIYLVDMLMSCTIVKFAKDDGLPENICTNCIDEINKAFSFSKRCETTEAILRKCVKIKIELEDDSSPSEKEEMREEIKIECTPEILPPVEEVQKDFEYVEVKQEVEEYDDLADENERNDDQDESDSEKSDHPGTSKIQGGSPKKRIRKKVKRPYYECKKCFEKFPEFKDLKKHREEVIHPFNAPSSCPVCNKMIGRLSMKRHMRTHTGEKPFCCEFCGDRFWQNANLKQHELARHSESEAKPILSRDFQCTECDRAFTTKRLLRQHSVMHAEKKFECNLCGKRFARKDSLNYHSKIHTGTHVQQHTCEVCGKTFGRSINLRSHMEIHTGIKSYICEICSKGFTKSTSLKTHMRIHTGEKPYTCKICDMAFSVPAALEYHTKTHSGVRPYTCEVCSKTFILSRHLQVHMRIHTGEKPYTCMVCGMSFARNEYLTVHKLSHIKETNEDTASQI